MVGYTTSPSLFLFTRHDVSLLACSSSRLRRDRTTARVCIASRLRQQSSDMGDPSIYAPLQYSQSVHNHIINLSSRMTTVPPRCPLHCLVHASRLSSRTSLPDLPPADPVVSWQSVTSTQPRTGYGLRGYHNHASHSKPVFSVFCLLEDTQPLTASPRRPTWCVPRRPKGSRQGHPPSLLGCVGSKVTPGETDLSTPLWPVHWHHWPQGRRKWPGIGR